MASDHVVKVSTQEICIEINQGARLQARTAVFLALLQNRNLGYEEAIRDSKVIVNKLAED